VHRLNLIGGQGNGRFNRTFKVSDEFRHQDLEALAAKVLAEQSDESLKDDIVEAEVVDDAEVVNEDQSDVVEAEAVHSSEQSYMNMPPRAYALPAGPVDSKQRQLHTKGGAVAGVMLGALSIFGAFLTGYSAINACLGLLLSSWGLSSSAKKLATTGLVLSLIGLILSLALGTTQ